MQITRIKFNGSLRAAHDVHAEAGEDKKSLRGISFNPHGDFIPNKDSVMAVNMKNNSTTHNNSMMESRFNR